MDIGILTTVMRSTIQELREAQAPTSGKTWQCNKDIGGGRRYLHDQDRTQIAEFDSGRADKDMANCAFVALVKNLPVAETMESALGVIEAQQAEIGILRRQLAKKPAAAPASKAAAKSVKEPATAAN